MTTKIRQSLWSNPLWWASIVLALLIGGSFLQ